MTIFNTLGLVIGSLLAYVTTLGTYTLGAATFGEANLVGNI